MNDQLYAVGFIVAVNLFISRQDKFFKHSRRNKGGSLASPVVVMEDGIRLYVFADLFRVLKLPVCKIVDQFLGCLRFFIEVHQAVLDLLKMVALLKDSGSDKLSDEIFVPVDLLNFLYKRFPVCVRIIQAGSVNIIFPMGDIFAYDMLFVMDRKASRSTFRPYIRYTPGVFHRPFTILCRRVMSHIRVHNYHGQSLILIYITIRFPAPDCF